MLPEQRGIADGLDALVLADGDELHLRGDDAAPCVVHLGDVGTGHRAARLQPRWETHRVQARVGFARTPEAGAQAVQQFGVAPLGHPAGPQRRQAAGEVDARGRVGIRARGVIHGDRCVFFATKQGWRAGQHDLAHGHLQVAARAGYMDLARAGDRSGDRFGQLPGLLLQGGKRCVHDFVLDRVRPGNGRNGRSGGARRTQHGRSSGGAALRRSASALRSIPTPVSTGSGSKGLSQPWPLGRGTPASGRIRPQRRRNWRTWTGVVRSAAGT
ncbi:hypothetical protein D3C71_1332090 [compost metagenome]